MISSLLCREHNPRAAPPQAGNSPECSNCWLAVNNVHQGIVGGIGYPHSTTAKQRACCIRVAKRHWTAHALPEGECAVCVQHPTIRGVLQFMANIAFCRGLPQRVSQDIHCEVPFRKGNGVSVCVPRHADWRVLLLVHSEPQSGRTAWSIHGCRRWNLVCAPTTLGKRRLNPPGNHRMRLPSPIVSTARPATACSGDCSDPSLEKTPSQRRGALFLGPSGFNYLPK